MTAAIQHVHEPTEREDPCNALVRAFEAQLQAMIDNGLEAPVRAIIGRLFPAPTPEPAPAPAPQFKQVAGVGVLELEDVTIDEEIELAALLADCRRVEKFKMSALSHGAVSRFKGLAERRLAAAKALRSAA